MKKTVIILSLMLALLLVLCSCGGSAPAVSDVPAEGTTTSTSIYRPTGTTSTQATSTTTTTIQIIRLPSTTTTTTAKADKTPVADKEDETTDTTTTTTTTVAIPTTSKELPPVDAGKKLIAITVDDGPSDLIGQFNDLFIQYNSRATYFLIGNRVSSVYADELTRAVENGIELGNHSYSHTNFKSAISNGTMTAAQVKADLERCNRAVRDTVGYDMKLIRLPHLAYNAGILGVCKELGMPCISRVLPGTGDADATSTTETVVARFMQDGKLLEGEGYTVQDGSIVLCHMKKDTLEALRQVIPVLIANGYQLVTVSELYEAFGYSEIPLGVSLGEAVPVKRKNG